MSSGEIRYLDNDIVKLYEFGKPRKKENLVATLFWGDNVRVIGQQDGQHKIELWRRNWDPNIKKYRWVRYLCALPAKTKFREKPLLKVRIIDVGQGDAAIIETPKGKIVLLDGGEEEHLRRYIQQAYSHILRERSLHCNAVVVTHGDADHFEGLTKLLNGHRTATTPIVTADRVYHNGLIKGSTEKVVDTFGETVKANGRTYIVNLVDDILQAPENSMNSPFKRWKAALTELKKSSPELKIKRIELGTQDAFDFMSDEGIEAEVFGPITEVINGQPALLFLKTPGGGLSASHTINGHSVVLRVTHGNVRFLFGADLNEESEERLLEAAHERNMSLKSEILKVPHHGSADFTPKMLAAVEPVVSIVSSGDENETKEYIHPRAGLVGALGKFSRTGLDKPLIYVTEMVAFFKRLGDITGTGTKGHEKDEQVQIHNAYQKTSFGIVHIRTDGERVLVATHSGKDDQKESYAFTVENSGQIQFEETSII